MKMKIKFLVILSICFVYAKAQTTLINESFNNGIPANWTTIDGDLATPFNDTMVNQLNGAFHISEDIDSTGSADSILIATSWFDNDSTEANNFLVTPSLTFTSAGNYLNFQAKSFDGSYPDGLEIFYISDINQIDSSTSSTMLFDTIAVPPFWADFQVKLDSIPLNSPIHLVFRHYATNQYILGLDNINVITGDLTSTHDLYSEAFSVYPNPSNGLIQIHGLENNIQHVTVNNAVGEIIFAGTAASLMKKQFSQGVYIIRTQNHSKLFIVN